MYYNNNNIEELLKDVRLALAIEAKKQTLKLSLRKLSSLYNIPFTTLRARINGRAWKADTIPKSRKLTPTEKRVIIERILNLDSRAFLIRRQNVKDMANILLGKRVQGRVGVNWASNFVRRQKKLRTRLNRKIDY